MEVRRDIFLNISNTITAMSQLAFPHSPEQGLTSSRGTEKAQRSGLVSRALYTCPMNGMARQGKGHRRVQRDAQGWKPERKRIKKRAYSRV